MKEPFLDLKKALRHGKQRTLEWYSIHVPNLSEEDLLTKGNFGCPCQECHKVQFELFQKSLQLCGHDELKKVIENASEPMEATLIPGASWVYTHWFKGEDIGTKSHPPKPLPIHEKEKPDIDKTLPFKDRWEMFLDSGKYRFAVCFFDITKDREQLSEAILSHDEPNNIVSELPTGKVSWKRLKNNLEEKVDPL